MKKIFLSLAAAALTIGFTACSSEDTTTTTTDVDTMSTTMPPADNTGQGIEGGGMNTTPTTDTAGTSMNNSGSNTSGNNTSGSSSPANRGGGSAQGGSTSSGIMGPGTNVTNTGGAASSGNQATNSRVPTPVAKNPANQPQRFEAGPDVKTPSAPTSNRGGNDVIERANETNDRSDRVKTPRDVNPRTGLAPVR